MTGNSVSWPMEDDIMTTPLFLCQLSADADAEAARRMSRRGRTTGLLLLLCLLLSVPALLFVALLPLPIACTASGENGAAGPTAALIRAVMHPTRAHAWMTMHDGSDRCVWARQFCIEVDLMCAPSSSTVKTRKP